jgi:hypothetical protein
MFLSQLRQGQFLGSLLGLEGLGYPNGERGRTGIGKA